MIFIVCAAFGLGLMGNILPTNKERYMNNEIRTKQVDKREEDTEESDETRH